jgi:isochorismate hydrolase
METDYLEQIKDYNIRQAWPIPEKTALLVIDMQLYFRELAEPILSNVSSLIDGCRASGVEIFFTRHGHRDHIKNGGMLSRWWEDLIYYGSAEWELIKELKANPRETILDKNRYSAFFGTNLDGRLRVKKVEDLVICGVMTNCCCETTARDAFVRDYRVFFVADATATASEELHLASLKNLAFGFAYIVNTKEICQKFKFSLR